VMADSIERLGGVNETAGQSASETIVPKETASTQAQVTEGVGEVQKYIRNFVQNNGSGRRSRGASLSVDGVSTRSFGRARKRRQPVSGPALAAGSALGAALSRWIVVRLEVATPGSKPGTGGWRHSAHEGGNRWLAPFRSPSGSTRRPEARMRSRVGGRTSSDLCDGELNSGRSFGRMHGSRIPLI